MKRSLIAVLLLATTACDNSPTQPESPTTNVELGQEISFNVQIGEGKFCKDADDRTGRVVAISQRAIVVADTRNPAGGFTDADYQSLAATFDTLVYPLNAENFGAPLDIDRNEKIVIFYTRAVNELTPRGQNWYVGGFFVSRDLFPRDKSPGFDACPTSNQAEMFYMLVPDPAGEVNGNSRSKANVQGVTVTTLAHEFQHLINASRRLYVVKAGGSGWNEQTWLNEGLSHIAEELLGYRLSGLAPRQNTDAARIGASPATAAAFATYLRPNFGLLASYLSNPDTASLMGPDELATRGAAWAFLRYAADRRGGSEAQFWKGLVEADRSGLENLRKAIGAEPMEWIRDWTVANYADDAVPSLDPRFTQPSWNFRSILPGLRSSSGAFPLKTRSLVSGVPVSVSIRGGSAAYFRFGVAPSTRAEVRLNPGTGGCLASGPAPSLRVGEVFSAAGDQAAALCFEGGLEGAEYTYIPFFASDVGTANLPLQVQATGVRPVTGPPMPSLEPSVASLFRQVADDGLAPARSWEMRLRQREIRELAPLAGGAGLPEPDGRYGAVPEMGTSAGATSVDSRLMVSVIRTR